MVRRHAPARITPPLAPANDPAPIGPCTVVETVVTDRVEDAYLRIHHRLWHALLGFSGDPEVASDAEAEAFSQAIRRGDELRDIDAWVWRSAFRIARGLLADRRRDRPLDDSTLPVSTIDDARAAEFLSQLGGLSEQQREVVVLRYVGAFRPSEIAELLHTSPGSVRVQLHRAHTKLRAALEDSDE